MKALLSVSFGTSYTATREKTIDAIAAKLRKEFPDRLFYSAWTSERIIKKVKEARGEFHDTLAEAFGKMSADGVDDLIVSTTCLMQGVEAAKAIDAVNAWLASGDRVARLARPLLSTFDDRNAVAQAICQEFSWIPDDQALLLMGHGSPCGPNEVYSQIQVALRELGHPRVFVATVEGEPKLEDILPVVEQCKPSCVHLAPLMIVAGDHAANDLAGDGTDSWASQVKARGMRVKVALKGLGEYAGIQELVCDHARQAPVVRGLSFRG